MDSKKQSDMHSSSQPTTPVFEVARLTQADIVTHAKNICASFDEVIFAGIVKAGEEDDTWHFDDRGNGRDYEPWPRTHTSPEGQQHFDMRSGAVSGGDVKPINQVDLLSAGSLGMGLDSEYFEGFLREAVKARDAEEEEEPECPKLDDAASSEGIVWLREGWQGLEIAFFDLKSYAARSGNNRDLAIVLPSQYQGRPITGIAAGAFPRRLVHGVGVKILVVPDSIKRIGANAFSCISVEQIHLGAQVQEFDAQQCDLSLTSPVRTGFSYSIEETNPYYQCREGSLFAKGGRILVFLAAPYAEEVILLPGVEAISREALAQGCAHPRAIHFESSLRDIRSRQWDNALWIGEPADALVRQMDSRGIRHVAPDAVRVGDCSYDFEDGCAVLVMGPGAPESASSRFAAAQAQKARGEESTTTSPLPMGMPSAARALTLPDTIQDAPLSSIAPYALQHAPETLFIPSSIKKIGHTNPARGLRHLVLSEGVEHIGARCFCSRSLQVPVDIPASVKSIGHGSFEYAICRFAANGAIVHVLADPLCSCFIGERDNGEMDTQAEGIPVDFDAYDQLILEGKNFPDRMGAILHRLSAPVPCSNSVQNALLGLLEADQSSVAARVAKEGDIAVVRALNEAGFIEGQCRVDMLEQLRSANRIDCVMYLMGTTSADQGQSVRERFAL